MGVHAGFTCAVCMHHACLQWDDCACGDCELCGGTLPVGFTDAELAEKERKRVASEKAAKERQLQADREAAEARQAAALAKAEQDRAELDLRIKTEAARIMALEEEVRVAVVCMHVRWRAQTDEALCMRLVSAAAAASGACHTSAMLV